jgi:Pyridoxamine 5'-phosphate oxidase
VAGRPAPPWHDRGVTDLATTAAAFVLMAHRIVWASVATVDRQGRPRSRILHPFWEWDGRDLTGWIATGPSPLKRAHLAGSPYVSVNYWAPDHDTAAAECRAEWIMDDAGREALWRRFAEAPAPVGYDPAIVPAWADGPTSPAFAGLRLTPWRLRVMPGTAMLGGGGETHTWTSSPSPSPSPSPDASA